MKILICWFAILSMIFVGAPLQAENWVLYDDFRGGFFNHGGINPDRWAGMVFATILPPNLWMGENLMEVLFGRFHILNHSYGGALQGAAFLEQDLFFRNYEGIKGIKARLNIHAAEVSACPLNPSLPLPIVRARLWGNFFKDSTLGLDVGTFLFVERSNAMDNNNEAFNILNVGATIAKCNDTSCGNYTPISPPITIGTVHLWENFDLSLQWDQPNHQFVYRLNNNPPISIQYAESLDAGPPNYAYRKAIGTIDFFAPCGAEGQEAFIDAYFDNVYVLK